MIHEVEGDAEPTRVCFRDLKPGDLLRFTRQSPIYMKVELIYVLTSGHPSAGRVTVANTVQLTGLGHCIYAESTLVIPMYVRGKVVVTESKEV